MQIYNKFGLLLLVLVFAFTSAAMADVDRDKDQRARSTASKTSAGECTSEGTASRNLDVNNVRAALYNNGNLFYAGADLYEVPKGSGNRSVFASGIWVGGYAGGQLRMAAATYSDYEFRPGPLFEDGTGPTNCADYDRMYKVNKLDIQNYEATGALTNDLRDWPVELGAPVIDGDGVPGNYNLEGGDRPAILGDQSIWWVMNDVSAPHNTTNTQPIGLEAQVMAFAFNQAGALGNTTFYRYRLTYRGDVPLTDTYLGVWSDPDLGGAGDDYVGSDSTLGLGFVYNGTPTDGTYGAIPPALGYDFFQGPLVPAPGETYVDPDGTVHENATRLPMQKFVYYNNDPSPQGNPGNAQEYYGYLSGFWRDGVPITFGGSGRDFSNQPTSYMYPSDPPAFWSEFNVDNQGTAVSPGDRRFIQSVGPFTLNPGDTQEIVFGIVWSQASAGEVGSNPHLDSLRKLKQDDALAQQVFDINFQLPPPPDAPRVTVTELDQEVILTWDYPSTSNNVAGSYVAPNPLISGVDDVTYDFEGYILYRSDTPGFQDPEVVAVFDKVNGITRILNETTDGLVTVDVAGTDSGIQNSYRFGGLTNYQEYYFGVQAYAYNEYSSPKTYKSPIRQVTAVPSRTGSRNGGTVVDLDILGAQPEVTATQTGQGSFTATVVDPSLVTGESYRVEFRSVTVPVLEPSELQTSMVPVVDENGNVVMQTLTVYDIFRGNTMIFNGEAYARNSGQATPLGTDVFQADGLSFSVEGPLGLLEIVTQIDADGNVIACLDFCLNHASTRPPIFFLTAQGASSPDAIVTRMDWLGEVGPRAPIDYEITFVENPEEEGQLVLNRSWDGADPAEAFMLGWTEGVDGMYNEDGTLTEVQRQTANRRMPFTAWEVYPDGTRRQVMASILDDDGDLYWDLNAAFAGETFGNAPAAYERIYLRAIDYDEEAMLADPLNNADIPYFNALATIGRVLIVPFGGWAALPQPGVTMRFTTTKPNLPGDVFTFDTADIAPQTGVAEALEESLDNITMVPNPYKGASAYETSRIRDVVKITNLPETATIRVYTLAGTLIKTIEKDSPGTSIEWDLETDNDLPIASGVYLVHVQTPAGERVLKFGVVKKRVQLNEL